MINKFNSSHFSSFIPYWTYSPSCVLISFFCIFITNKLISIYFFTPLSPLSRFFLWLCLFLSPFISFLTLLFLFITLPFLLSHFRSFYHTSVPFITLPFLLSHFRSFYHTPVPFITFNIHDRNNLKNWRGSTQTEIYIFNKMWN